MHGVEEITVDSYGGKAIIVFGAFESVDFNEVYSLVGGDMSIAAYDCIPGGDQVVLMVRIRCELSYITRSKTDGRCAQ